MKEDRRARQDEVREALAPSYAPPRRSGLKLEDIPVTEPGIPGLLKDIGLLRNLKPGWVGDGTGDKFSPEGLDWLMEALEKHYPRDCELPLAFPGHEGSVSLEWPMHDKHRAEVEVYLEEGRGEWLAVTLGKKDFEEAELDLKSQDGWRELGRLVRDFSSRE